MISSIALMISSNILLSNVKPDVKPVPEIKAVFSENLGSNR